MSSHKNFRNLRNHYLSGPTEWESAASSNQKGQVDSSLDGSWQPEGDFRVASDLNTDAQSAAEFSGFEGIQSSLENPSLDERNEFAIDSGSQTQFSPPGLGRTGGPEAVDSFGPPVLGSFKEMAENLLEKYSQRGFEASLPKYDALDPLKRLVWAVETEMPTETEVYAREIGVIALTLLNRAQSKMLGDMSYQFEHNTQPERLFNVEFLEGLCHDFSLLRTKLFAQTSKREVDNPDSWFRPQALNPASIPPEYFERNSTNRHCSLSPSMTEFKRKCRGCTTARRLCNFNNPQDSSCRLCTETNEPCIIDRTTGRGRVYGNRPPQTSVTGVMNASDGAV